MQSGIAARHRSRGEHVEDGGAGRSYRVGPTLALLACVGAGCIYDAKDVCSPGQVQDRTLDQCICAPNHVPVKRPITVLAPTAGDAPLIAQCVPCGEHSTATGDKCVCEAGFVQGANGCVTSNLGIACATDIDCQNGDANHCEVGTGATSASGYCTTTGCTATPECNVASDYACVVGTDSSFCRRPPMNEGKVCTMQGPDPVCGMAAPFCILGGCASIACATDGDCSPSRKCCDLSVFSPGLHACLGGACP